MYLLYYIIHCIFWIILCNILNQFCTSNPFNSQHWNKTYSHFFSNHHQQSKYISQIFSKYLYNLFVFFTISFVAIIHLSTITCHFSCITLSSSTSSSFSSSLLIFFCFSFSLYFITIISCMLTCLSFWHILHSIFSFLHSIQTLHSFKYSFNIQHLHSASSTNNQINQSLSS